MRTLFLHRRWRDRFASSGRFRLRTFAERSVEHLKRWAFVYVAIAAIALWFHAALRLRAERLAQPAAPALPDPQGRAAQPRRLTSPSAGPAAARTRRASPSSRCSPACPATTSRAMRPGFFVNGVPVGMRQAGEPAGSAARTRSHRPDSGGPLLRASPAPGQPRLALPADRLDPRSPRSSDGPMRSSDRAIASGTACGMAAAPRSGGLRRHVRDGVRPRPGPRRHRPGLPDRRAEPAGSDPREASREPSEDGDARPSATRGAGAGQARRRRPAPVAGLTTHRQRAAASTTTRASSCRTPSRDADGRVIVAAGHAWSIRSTPCRSSQALLFIDARDRRSRSRAHASSSTSARAR